MGASVRIEDEAFSDERYSDLAAAAKLSDADHARGKMLRLWRQCTIEQTHFLPREIVCRILGERGVEALVFARLGEETERGIRIRGTRGRIEWLKKLRDNGKFGGRGGRPRNNPDGFRAEKPMRVSKNAKSKTPPAPAPAPAPAPPDPDPESLSAHAIQPSPVPSTTPAQSFAARDLARARERGDLALATWQRLSELRMRHASKLRLEGALPLPAIAPSKEPHAFRELRERIREEGDNARAVCDHVLRVLDDQATDTKSIEWLSDKAFLERPWAKARETVIGKRKPPVAAPPPPAPIAPADLAGSAELAAAWSLLGIAKEPA